MTRRCSRRRRQQQALIDDLRRQDAKLGRQDLRDALRALRGTILRTELYALDGSDLQGRPYTVTESLQGLREVPNPLAQSGELRDLLPACARPADHAVGARRRADDAVLLYRRL